MSYHHSVLIKVCDNICIVDIGLVITRGLTPTRILYNLLGMESCPKKLEILVTYKVPKVDAHHIISHKRCWLI